MNAGETGAEDGYACCKMVLKNELGDIFGENNPSSVPTSTKQWQNNSPRANAASQSRKARKGSRNPPTTPVAAGSHHL